MAVDRIYGNFQTAGVKVTTAAKSAPNSAGTDGYAQLVGALGADGLTLASAANPIPVTDSTAPPSAGSDFVSISGTITVGGTAQNLVAAASGYSYVELNNPANATESLFFNDTGAACTNNPAVDTEIFAGGSYIWSRWGSVPVPTDAISINAATTAHAYRAKRV